jgi:hypothetical protein
MGQRADEIDRDDLRRDAENSGFTPTDVTLGAGDAAEGDEETQEIRGRIEQTRVEMSETIDAIQEKLNPQNIVEQAKDSVREATIGRAEQMVQEAGYQAREMSSGLIDKIKQNPIPAAMAGIGIWLLMRDNNSSKNRERYYGGREFYRGDEQGYGSWTGVRQSGYNRTGAQGSYYESGRGGGIGDKAGQAAEKVGDIASGAKDQAGNIVGGAADAVGNVASGAAQTVGNVAGGIGERAGDIAGGARYGAEQATDQISRLLRENPLAVGAGALVAGLAVGLLVPETEPEHRLMGEARDNLMDKAQEAVQGTVQKVQSVAEQAGDTIRQEAENQGLTGQTSTTY